MIQAAPDPSPAKSLEKRRDAVLGALEALFEADAAVVARYEREENEDARRILRLWGPMLHVSVQGAAVLGMSPGSQSPANPALDEAFELARDLAAQARVDAHSKHPVGTHVA